MFAHTVHLGNVGATLQQSLVDTLFVLQREPIRRQRQQRGAAARNQAQHQVVFSQALGQGHHAFGSGQTGGIGHRVGGFNNLNAWPHARRPLGRMAVTGDDETRQGRLSGPQGLYRMRHGGGSFASAQNHSAPGGLGQKCAHAVQRHGAPHRNGKQLLKKRQRRSYRVSRYNVVQGRGFIHRNGVRGWCSGVRRV